MKYYSTNKTSPLVDFKEATINGQAPDKGLYFPGEIPVIENEFIRKIEKIPDEEIGFRVIQPFVGDTIPAGKLMEIVKETLSFPIPLIAINDAIFSLELFHGPTLAFKDIGARFMSRCLGYFVSQQDKEITVLVATSGDTGSAVANGFLGVEGVKVIILYPSGKVSQVQEKQMTTLGRNIQALEVEGSFDDCQRMVKMAFTDNEIIVKRFLTSANSINVARWLPQQFYYFFAWKQWREKETAPVIAVPSGNFGNICAGLLAKRSGLPLGHFIAACNANDAVTRWLATATFEVKAAIPTVSNAMDVGDPSNFVRMLELFHHQFRDLKDHLSSYSITDAETMATIKELYEKHQYLADPHGAVGYRSLQLYLKHHPHKKGIFLETAHPAKFPAAIEQVTGKPMTIPAVLSDMMNREKQSIHIKNSYENFKEYLLK